MRTVKIGTKFAIPLPTFIAVASLAAVAVLIFTNSSAIAAQLNSWKLLPQPERLTELYFTDHAKLATTYTPGAPQKFGFMVHNLEYRHIDYSYTVTAVSEDGSQTQELASNRISLPADGYSGGPIEFTPNDLGRRVKIVTTLTYTSDKPVTESIYYWVTSTAPVPTAEVAPVVNEEGA